MNEPRDTFGRATVNHIIPTPEIAQDDTLRPYQDTAYFKKRFLESNRYLRHNPELSDAIQHTLLADDDQSILDTVELLDIARQVDSPAQQPPISALLAQLSFSREINNAKVALVGAEAPADRTNAIIGLVQNSLIDQLDDELIAEYRAATSLIRQQFETPTFQHNRDIDVAWYTTKLRYIEAGLDNRQLAITHIHELPGEDTESFSMSDAVTDSQEIAALFESNRRHQRYGVKMGYKKQSRQAGSLIYAPNLAQEVYAAEGSTNLHPLALARDYAPLCHVIDSPTSSFKKRLSFSDVTRAGARAFTINVAARGAFNILPDGELQANGSGLLMRDMALKYHKYTAYRQLQAEVLADYLDLTNPADHTVHHRQATKQLPQGITTQESESRKASDVVTEILLARLRYQRTEREAEATETHSTREVRLHGVVWHIRQLPKGWKASPGAEELATQAGMTLREGETFVRPHKRGTKKLGEVVAHHLVKRS